MNNIIIKRIDPTTKDEMHFFLANESLKLYFKLHHDKLQIAKNNPTIIDNYLNQIVVKLNGDELVYGAYLDDEIIGCGYIDNNNRLDSLFVKEKYRNLGVGSSLLEKLINNCNQTKAITLNANIEAISLYERYSFHKTSDIINCYFVQMERKPSYGKNLFN